MLIAVVSAKGSPGVTVASLAWAMQWPRPVLLAECDPRGSDMVVGYAQSSAGAGRDLLSVHMASKRGAPMDLAVRDNAFQLGPQSWLLLGVPEPQQATAVDWHRLSSTLSRLGLDVIADCGSVSTATAPRPVWAAADLTVMVVRPTAIGVRAAQLALPRLRRDLTDLGKGADRLVAVVVESGPYSVAEVREALAGDEDGPIEQRGVPVLTTLAADAGAAEHLSTGIKPRRGRDFERTSLASSARKSALALIERGEVVAVEAAGSVTAGAARRSPAVAPLAPDPASSPRSLLAPESTAVGTSGQGTTSGGAWI